MRTYADRQKDLQSARYDDEDPTIDPTTPSGAKRMLATLGGKNAAKLAIACLWEARKEWRDGWMPTARIPAPLRVLEALNTVGLVEQADDNRGVAIRVRLTATGVQMAAKAQLKE